MIYLITLVCLLAALVLGAFSSIMLAWQYTIGAATQLVGVTLLGAIVLVALWVFFYFRKRVPPQTIQLSFGAPGAAFAVAAAFAFYWMFRHAKAYPDGKWDGWAIWNLHARFLYRGNIGTWRDLFAKGISSWSHFDYPLLLPGLISASWTVIGKETPLASAVVSTLFGLLSIAILISAVLAITKDSRGWLAGLILLATPNFLLQSAHQMADIPLAAYILTTIVAFRMSDVWIECRPQLLLIAGFSAGLAAWTKNEGILFAAVFVTVMCVLRNWKRDWRSLSDEAVWLIAGLIPMLVVLLVFKLSLASPNDIMSHVALVQRLTDPRRYVQIAAAFGKQILHIGEFGINPLLLVLGYLAIYWPKERISANQIRLILLPLLVSAGYFAVYLISPFDLTWHLSSSLDRLFLQLWPMSLFIAVTLPIQTEAGAATGLRETLFKSAAQRNVFALEAIVAIAAIIVGVRHQIPLDRQASQTTREIIFKSTGSLVTVPLSSDGTRETGQVRAEQTQPGPFSMLEIIRYQSTSMVDAEAIIPVPDAAKEAVFPCRDGQLFESAIAVANPSSAFAEFTLTFDSHFAANFRLAPEAGVSGFLRELVPESSGRNGTCRISASVPIAISVLLTTASASTFRMTAVPVSEGATLPASSQIVPYQLDNGLWNLELTLTNNTSRTIRGAQRWYTGAGRLAATVPYEIPPYTVHSVARHPDDRTSGYVEVSPEPGSVAPQAALLLVKMDGMEPQWIVDIPAQNSNPPSFPVDESPGVETRFLAVNSGTSPAMVRTAGSDGSGIEVPPHELELLPAPGIRDTAGIARFAAPAAVSIFALRYLAGTGNLLGSVPGTAPAASVAFFPHFAVGDNFTTTLISYSPQGAAFSGRATLFDRSGHRINP